MHLNESNRILTELSTINVKIEQEDKALLLLNSLPTSFDHIITTLLFWKETLKFDEVITLWLLNEYRRKSCNDAMFGKYSALVSSYIIGRDQGQSMKRQDYSSGHKGCSRPKSHMPFLCWYCNKKGHTKKNNPERKESLYEKKDTSSTMVASDDT